MDTFNPPTKVGLMKITHLYLFILLGIIILIIGLKIIHRMIDKYNRGQHDQ